MVEYKVEEFVWKIYPNISVKLEFFNVLILINNLKGNSFSL